MFHHTFYIHVGSLQCDFFHVSEAHGITNADYIFTSTEFLSSVSYFMLSKIMEITKYFTTFFTTYGFSSGR